MQTCTIDTSGPVITDMDVAIEQHIHEKMQRQRHACTGRHARRGTGGDSSGGEQGGIQSGDGGSTREERSVEGGDMGSTRVVGDVEGEGVVTTGGEGGVGGIEYSDADREEEERVRKFCTEGCGCALVNSSPCSTQFTIEHFREMRGNAAELSWSELNMSVMSQIMAFTSCNSTPLNSSKHRHKQKTRERNSTSFHHHGLWVCRKTFLFLHNIGKARLQDLRSRYLSNGLVPRLHGHTGRVAPNAVNMEAVQRIIAFVMQYAEINALLLPGRIPGYKRDDLQILPSSTTKRAVWCLYQTEAERQSIREVSYSTFCRIWREFLGHVVVCKPMTDLCATCQKNSTAIVRSINLSEEEKSQVCTQDYNTYVYLYVHVNAPALCADTQGSRRALDESNM